MASERYTWDPRSRRYRDVDSGRFISVDVATTIRDRVLDAQAVRAGYLVDSLVDGTMTVQAFDRELRARVPVDLAPGHLVPGSRDHRVSLQCPGAKRSGVLDRRRRQVVGEPLAPMAHPDHEACQRPNVFVAPVLGPALPRSLTQPYELAATIDRAPADRLALEIGDQPARGFRVRIAAVGLLTEAEDALLTRDRVIPPLLRGGAELLAQAPAGVPPGAEDGEEVITRCLVGRDHDQPGQGRRPHRPLGCQTVLVSVNAAIRYGLCTGPLAPGRTTRFTLCTAPSWMRSA